MFKKQKIDDDDSLLSEPLIEDESKKKKNKGKDAKNGKDKSKKGGP